MITQKNLEHPCWVFRNKDLSLQSRCFYQILIAEPYIRPKSLNIIDLIDYFKQFTDESESEIREYIMELAETKLFELE